MADFITIFLGFSRIILGLLLILFIPGYVISFIFYPRIADIAYISRIVLSCVISIGSTLCAILFFDIFLGVDTTPVNSTLIILFVTAVAFIILGIRWGYYKVMEKQQKTINYPKDL